MLDRWGFTRRDCRAQNALQNMTAQPSARRAFRQRKRRQHISTTFLTASRSLFIRTMTVGPGIKPGLLTLSSKACWHGFGDKRSRAKHIACHYRRWGISPRPENVCGLPCIKHNEWPQPEFIMVSKQTPGLTSDSLIPSSRTSLSNSMQLCGKRAGAPINSCACRGRPFRESIRAVHVRPA